MSSFDTFKEYLALKKHFGTKEYDYFKYNGKVRASQESFNKRKDKYFFEKLSKHSDVHGFLVANFSDNPNYWIRDLSYSDDAQERYVSWLKRQQSLAYTFKSDLSKLSEKMYDNFICRNGYHPVLLKSYLGKEITLETLCILLNMFSSIKYWDKHMEYDPIWEEVSNKVKKYTPFIKYDKEKFKKIVIDLYGEIE